MTSRRIVRLAFVSALLLPVGAISASTTRSQSQMPQVPMGLSVATTPDRATVRYTTTTGSTLFAEATTVNVSYTGARLTLDLTGGTLTTSDGQTQQFRTLRLSFTGTDLREMTLSNR